MSRPLSRNERRIFALGLLALLLWAGWYVFVDSWFAAPMASLDQQAQALQNQHQRYARALTQAPALHAELERVRQAPASRRSLLPGNDPSAVAADLMQLAVDRVKAVAALGPGCAVTQRVPIVPEQDSARAYRQVKVSLALECGTQPLMQLLHAFEYGQPSLFVEALSISRAANAQPIGPAGRMKVQLLLRGYLTAAAKAPSA
jgi:general secretion pathway protein M